MSNVAVVDQDERLTQQAAAAPIQGVEGAPASIASSSHPRGVQMNREEELQRAKETGPSSDYLQEIGLDNDGVDEDRESVELDDGNYIDRMVSTLAVLRKSFVKERGRRKELEGRLLLLRKKIKVMENTMQEQETINVRLFKMKEAITTELEEVKNVRERERQVESIFSIFGSKKSVHARNKKLERDFMHFRKRYYKIQNDASVAKKELTTTKEQHGANMEAAQKYITELEERLRLREADLSDTVKRFRLLEQRCKEEVTSHDASLAVIKDLKGELEERVEDLKREKDEKTDLQLRLEAAEMRLRERAEELADARRSMEQKMEGMRKEMSRERVGWAREMERVQVELRDAQRALEIAQRTPVVVPLSREGNDHGGGRESVKGGGGQGGREQDERKRVKMQRDETMRERDDRSEAENENNYQKEPKSVIPRNPSPSTLEETKTLVTNPDTVSPRSLTSPTPHPPSSSTAASSDNGSNILSPSPEGFHFGFSEMTQRFYFRKIRRVMGTWNCILDVRKNLTSGESTLELMYKGERFVRRGTIIREIIPLNPVRIDCLGKKRKKEEMSKSYHLSSY